MPMTLVTSAAASDSRSTLITGTAPTELASKRRKTPASSAACSSSAPCCERSCLLAVTTDLPAFSAPSWKSRAGSMPPMSSTTMSMPGSPTISAKSAVTGTPSGTRPRPLGVPLEDAAQLDVPARGQPDLLGLFDEQPARRRSRPCRSPASRSLPYPSPQPPASPQRVLAPAPRAAAAGARRPPRSRARSRRAPRRRSTKTTAGARLSVVVVGHRVAVGAGARRRRARGPPRRRRSPRSRGGRRRCGGSTADR